jgi:hypothetical protein
MKCVMCYQPKVEGTYEYGAVKKGTFLTSLSTTKG